MVSAAGGELVSATSGEVGCSEHAGARALAKARRGRHRLSGATLYVTVEPCLHRREQRVSCTHLLLLTEVRRLVYAIPDPNPNRHPGGARHLSAMGWDVIRLDELSRICRGMTVGVPDLRASGEGWYRGGSGRRGTFPAVASELSSIHASQPAGRRPRKTASGRPPNPRTWARFRALTAQSCLELRREDPGRIPRAGVPGAQEQGACDVRPRRRAGCTLEKAGRSG
jgi:pyrimidine deaminase RibD-like protein